MARYQCTSCGHEFEASGDKLRCPQCLRQNGLEEIDADQPRRRSHAARGDSPRRLLLVVSLLTLAALAGAGALWAFKKKAEVPKPGELAILDGALLTQTLQKRGVEHTDIVNPFAYGPSLKKLIGSLPSGSGAPQAKAIAAKLAPILAPLRIDTSGQAKEPIRTPEEFATDHLDKGVKVTTCTSYEAAILLTALLREAGQAALVAEIFTLDAPMSSADPSILGRFVVAIYPKDKLGQKPLLVLDPARAAKLPAWAGGGGDATMANKAKALVPLDDATVVAHLYSQRAVREIAKHPKAPERAYELSQRALKLAYKSATIHAARAIILAQAGQGAAVNDALDEARKAIALHPDAPRHTVLAQLMLLSRDPKGAQKELKKAIALDANYWPAHQTLATIRWLLGDREGGRKEIDLAIKVAPKEPTIMALQASQLMADGDDDRAVALLREAVKKSPTEQLQLQLLVGLIKATKDKEARALRKKILKETSHKDLILAQLKRIEDATGFDPGDDADKSDADKSDADKSDADKSEKLIPGMKLPDVKLAPPAGMNTPLKLPDVKLTP